MEHKDIELQIKKYYEQGNDDTFDTIKLINSLKPTIIFKCENIKKKREKKFETVIFTVCEVLAIIIGLILMFPEIIDYTDELLQFGCIAILTTIAIGGIYLTMKAIVTPRQMFKLRRI